MPGHIGEIDDTAHAIEISEEIGYPVMIKASAGGGGKGIRVAWNRSDVEEGFPAVRAEAKGAFGDDRIFIEKFIESPRHIEIQVLGDKHGHVVHLFERECSIQRRNQKVIEEAPSPLLDADDPRRHGRPGRRPGPGGELRLAPARSSSSPARTRASIFLEMNTRLQVEHPVTELITGARPGRADDPRRRRRAAGVRAGRPGDQRLGDREPASTPRTPTAVPALHRPAGALPAAGRGRARRLDVVRNDTGVREGDEISMFYDPMIAKLCAWAPDRAGAVAGMGRALEDFHIEGLGHNIAVPVGGDGPAAVRLGPALHQLHRRRIPRRLSRASAQPLQIDVMTAAAAAMHRMQAARARRSGNGLIGPAARTTGSWWSATRGGPCAWRSATAP